MPIYNRSLSYRRYFRRYDEAQDKATYDPMFKGTLCDGNTSIELSSVTGEAHTHVGSVDSVMSYDLNAEIGRICKSIATLTKRVAFIKTELELRGFPPETIDAIIRAAGVAIPNGHRPHLS